MTLWLFHQVTGTPPNLPGYRPPHGPSGWWGRGSGVEKHRGQSPACLTFRMPLKGSVRWSLSCWITETLFPEGARLWSAL